MQKNTKIKKGTENNLEIWGDGEQTRSFYILMIA